jgi:diguanylate cyclase (GGDEF)-like protein
LNTALCFLSFEFGVLAASAHRGPMAAILSPRAGGRVARRLLPAIVVLPVLFGGVGIAGERLGWFPGEFAVALLVTFSVIGLALLVVMAARWLNRGDAEVERLLTIDTLTGVLNRRAIMETLGAETASALRYGRPLSIAMIDIDHFKQINDNHGHAMGDKVLKALGVSLGSSLRATDAVGRFGGEEFIAIFPDTPLPGAMIYAERLLAEGAAGYIMKHAATDQLINALRAVLRGETYLSETMRSRVAQRTAPSAEPRSRLSARELQVINLVGRGVSSRDIANNLSLSVKTIESHRAAIKRKLGLTTNVQLVQYAIQWHGRSDA